MFIKSVKDVKDTMSCKVYTVPHTYVNDENLYTDIYNLTKKDGFYPFRRRTPDEPTVFYLKVLLIYGSENGKKDLGYKHLRVQ